MTIETIWQEFLHIIRAEAGSRIVDTWFKAVRFAHWDRVAHVAYLEAPNSFVRQWLATHYADLVKTSLKRLLNEEQITVIFIDQGTSEQVSQGQTTSLLYQPAKLATDESLCLPEEKAVVVKPATSLPAVQTDTKVRSVLVTHYRFDTFVVGPTNTLAFSAAQAVAEQMGKLYNPLFIYGGSGLGKRIFCTRSATLFVRTTKRLLFCINQPIDLYKSL